MKVYKYLIFTSVYYLIYFFVLYLNSFDNPKVQIIDVGQGDSILLTSTHGRKLLVDGGGDYTADSFIKWRIPFYDCTIDQVFLSHFHQDHYFGLSRILKRCNYFSLTFNDIDLASGSNDEFGQFPENKLHKKTFMNDNFYFDNFFIKVLWPQKNYKTFSKNLNNTSIVLFVDYGSFETILLGDAQVEVLKLLNLSTVKPFIDGPLDVLKVSHHGSINGYLPALVMALKPRYCAVSVGQNNSFGHPSLEAIKGLEAQGCRVLRTDISGTIELPIK